MPSDEQPLHVLSCDYLHIFPAIVLSINDDLTTNSLLSQLLADRRVCWPTHIVVVAIKEKLPVFNMPSCGRQVEGCSVCIWLYQNVHCLVY